MLTIHDFLCLFILSMASASALFIDLPRGFRQRWSVGEVNSNGTTYLWLLEDTYEGDTFFDTFDFYNASDPTHYVNESYAFSAGLAYVESDGVVIMKGDNTTWLAEGAYRDSVRISSQKEYNTGLFILDLNMAPWGCGVWPAFWTLGSGTWPYTGEIDIIEGVHDNEHNQVTWHTGSGKPFFTLFTTDGKNNTDCDGDANDNSGCGVTEWSRASYGPYFDAQGGGVFAMKWDVNGIAIWSFYRAAIPQDIKDGIPAPSTWGTPVAQLDPAYCNPIEYFVNHSIIFGDWAGNDYTTSGCPGTCAERIMDPANFNNASWSINSLKVYRTQLLNAHISSARSLAWTLIFAGLLL
ncbi:glycoside hydrolase family 16 protein [Fistulina hepatica ATCC 64428]|uniref:Glycoside hydrolase family 16 protein n=1 Tax=Fistulina hepatica ATCC 64428 TaxID=1128425 RepID=A0A0D7APP6_9AGAR|nr:glycoside hydrolase family 16 protein [Fistulina hepatica ATCC 64428]